MKLRIAIVLAAALAACGTSSSGNPPHPDAHTGSSTDAPPPHPDGPPADAFASTCGQPGDQGNELGVGKFCQTLNDCNGTPSAPLCSNLGDETTFFCTKFCTSGGSADQCGTAASCTCNSNNQCGCTPNACL